ncbi:hypothetical protein [Mucisphaera calidilacus]|uniref:PEP-CTERM protein-sorting domain-containing protein n=1 Tax=Mucisphaera calidilacus TaxID=2527982 RepID=A0A518BU66_9BACT|nr:hypothetical protein [Mucisphaera calidilacus]QDU70525.1 hypothetical protein Pan265_03530 [Mucisphaera calidilacus]
MLKRILAPSLLAALAIVPVASGAALYSFEDLPVGSPAAGNGLIVDSGDGITDGVQALRLSDSSGWYDKLGHVRLDGLIDPATPVSMFTVDWYFEAGPNSAGSYNGLTAAFFNQTTSTFLQLNNVTGQYIGSDAGANGAYTPVYNLSAAEQSFLMGALQSGEAIAFELYSNKDGSGVNGTYTVDNIRFDGALVPTPTAASMTLLGLAGMALRRR